MHKDQSYQYGFSDIEKYLKGELSPAAMHELEKAALTDPFLADAIEGYQAAELFNSHQHLEEIRDRVLQGDVKGKIVPFIQPRFKWFRIASIFIIVAGMATIGWLVMKTDRAVAPTTVQFERKDSHLRSSKPEQQTITASTDKRPKTLRSSAKATVPAIVATTFDSLMPGALADNKIQASPVTTQLYSYKRVAKDSFNTLKTLQKSEAKLDHVNNFDQLLQGSVAGVSVSNAKQPYLIQGKVLDSEQKPLPNASVRLLSASVNTIVTTNADGIFQLSSKDSAARVAVSALGYEPLQSTLKAASTNLVSLNAQSNTLSEVVVTGYGKERKSQLAGSVSAATTMQQKSLALEPTGGMQQWVRSVHQKWE